MAKLDVKALGLSLGIMWGAAVALIALTFIFSKQYLGLGLDTIEHSLK